MNSVNLLTCLILLSSCTHRDPSADQGSVDTPKDAGNAPLVERLGCNSKYDTILADSPPYRVVRRTPVNAPSIALLHEDTVIYSRTVPESSPESNHTMGIGLAYGLLANRSDQPQPEPFDDILGNGLPDLVIIEYSIGGTFGTTSNMLSVISIDGTSIVEIPAVTCYGEIFYFKDFDNDGSLEIVNTDWEQGFRKFDPNGVPMHKGIWKYDRKHGRFRQTGTEPPDPPDTWPAYRTNNQQ